MQKITHQPTRGKAVSKELGRVAGAWGVQLFSKRDTYLADEARRRNTYITQVVKEM